MKKIIIKGKRNIEGIKGEKGKRKITEKVNKKVFNELSQVEYLNKVYLDKEYFVEKFTGNISFNKNKIDNAKIDGKFSDGKVISFKVFISSSKIL